MLSFLPPEMETPFILIAPVVAVVDPGGAAVGRGRGREELVAAAVAVFSVMFLAICFGVFTHLGTYTPWSPQMNAWSGAAVPVQYLQSRTPLERQGAIVFQEKQCRNCHSLGGLGGHARAGAR